MRKAQKALNPIVLGSCRFLEAKTWPARPHISLLIPSPPPSRPNKQTSIITTHRTYFKRVLSEQCKKYSYMVRFPCGLHFIVSVSFSATVSQFTHFLTQLQGDRRKITAPDNYFNPFTIEKYERNSRCFPTCQTKNQ